MIIIIMIIITSWKEVAWADILLLRIKSKWLKTKGYKNVDFIIREICFRLFLANFKGVRVTSFVAMAIVQWY